MFKVDLKVKLKSLLGVDTDVDLNEIIANAISQCGAEQATKASLKPTKLIGWAESLAKGEALQLDPTDFESLRSFVGLLQNLNINVLAQADRIFFSAKNSSTKE